MKLISRLFSLCLCLLLTACGATFDPDVPRVSGQRHLNVTLKDTKGWIPAIARDTLSRRILGLRWNAIAKDFNASEFELWPEPNHFVSDARLSTLAEQFRQDPWVESVEASFDASVEQKGEASLPIDDPVWYLGPLGINAYQAWQLIRSQGKEPGQGVLIGLPDTGYLQHPELFHDDGTTQLRLDLQYNFSEPDNAASALDFCGTLCGITFNKTIKLAYVGHGSTTASLMISPAGKQAGTVGSLHTEGAAPAAEVIPIRVAPSVLMTATAMHNLAQGIQYAVQQGAQVISISMGGISPQDEALRQAIQEAYNNGVIVVVAAGNVPYGNPFPFLVGVAKPASYPETIAVCGSNAYQKPWRDSAKGSEVDICAPAEDIRRARAGWVNLFTHVNDTDRSEGTSMATALTASVAAMWISYHGYDNLVAHYQDPAKLTEAFRQILRTHGHRRPGDWNTDLYGAGILDAEQVLLAPLPQI